MRELNSLSKKSSVVERPLFSLSLFLILSFTACRGRAPVTPDVTGSSPRKGLSGGSSSLLTISDSIKENWIELRTVSSGKSPGFIRLNAKSCIDQKFVFNASLLVLGQGYDISFEEENGQLMVALVEDAETKLLGAEIPEELKTEVCGATRDPVDGFITVSDERHAALARTLIAAMGKMVPDCKSIEVDSRVARCQLDALLPQPALVKTEDFQKAMIRKWSRQPYILARRTGVVSTLAKTVTDLANNDGVAKFCRVLQFSIPEELPVVMTSHRWQQALCSGDSKLRREAALFGLAKGTQELAMLRELYEGTSRVGLLSVKIPIQTIPGRAQEVSRQPLRVTIAPDDTVSQNLVDEAKKYLGRSDNDDRPRKLLRGKRSGRSKKYFETAVMSGKATEVDLAKAQRADMCWHPVFGESWGLLRIADGMRLTGEGFNLECGLIYERTDASSKEIASLSRYLLQSLSSETEFVMDNGQSKLLRLPEGHYKYTVHVLPANPLDSEDFDDESSPKTTGEIGWGESRNHAIRTW
jgi:hypothetical protein